VLFFVNKYDFRHRYYEKREMSTMTEETSDQRQSPAIAALLRGSMLRGPSSIDLGWDGFAIERHSVGAGERPEKYSDHHFMLLWDVHSCHGERADSNGRFVTYRRGPGVFSLFTAGIIRPVRVFTGMEVIASAFSPSLVNHIQEELDRRPTELHDQYDFRDDGLRSLVSLLLTESEARGPCGRLYADSLTHALAARFIQLGQAVSRSEGATKCKLPGNVLRRVLERMNAEYSTDLSLIALAAESGYSRGYFLRLFRAATERTPYQYLLDLRMEKAVQLLRGRSASLVEVAAACGFKSHAAFTKVFRSKFGVVPSQYRRSL
jgi:AraC family transcriptional regulator